MLTASVTVSPTFAAGSVTFSTVTVGSETATADTTIRLITIAILTKIESIFFMCVFPFFYEIFFIQRLCGMVYSFYLTAPDHPGAAGFTINNLPVYGELQQRLYCLLFRRR